MSQLNKAVAGQTISCTGAANGTQTFYATVSASGILYSRIVSAGSGCIGGSGDTGWVTGTATMTCVNFVVGLNGIFATGSDIFGNFSQLCSASWH